MGMLLGRRGGGAPSDGATDANENAREGATDVADEAAAPAPASDAPRLHHEPALDGLRGVAVLAVLVFHLGRLQGGFLGVDLFFALSGFLITSLLVLEHRNHGRIDLRAFWVRRARRLFPALLLLLGGVAVLLATWTAVADRPRFRGDALATLGYVANWHRMTSTTSYWDIFSQPSPLDHTWSLAIEEQFYLVWPLVALAVLGGWRAVRRRRRPAGVVADASSSDGPGSARSARRLGMVALVGGAVSLGLLALTWSPVDTNRAYFGTDTRLGPTLLGAAVATVTARRARRSGPPHPALDVAAAVALVGIGLAFLATDGTGPAYYRGGLAAFTLAVLVVMVAVTGGPPGRVARLLAWRPLVWLGAISYGVYLWHWPVIVYLTPQRLGVRRAVAEVICVAVTMLLAVASYRLVEQPVRRGALRGRVAFLATGAAVAAVLAAAVVTTRGPVATDGVASAVTSTGRPYQIVPEDPPEGAVRLLLVGDSGPIFLGPELVDAAAADGDRFAIGMSSMVTCPPALLSTQVRYEGGRTVERELCPDIRHERWHDLAERMEADVVVYYLANAGGLGTQYVDDRWVTDCDPAYDELLEEELTKDVDLLGSTGATVVLATSPAVHMMTATSGAQVDCRNETYRRVAAARPGTEMIDLHGVVGALDPPEGESLFIDFVHLSEWSAVEVAAWMLPEVERVLAEGTDAANPIA